MATLSYTPSFFLLGYRFAEKIPASKVGHQNGAKHSISPDSKSATEELIALRAKNKMLMETLAAIKQTANKEMKEKFDLVWYAKFRYRYPNHEASSRIDKEHKEMIQNLRSDDGDYHHGFNSGVLAATRMFAAQADVLHINDLALSPELMEEGAKHQKKIEVAKESFPHVEVDNNFPKHA